MRRRLRQARRRVGRDRPPGPQAAEPAGAGAEIIHLDFAHPAAAEPEWSRETPFAAEVLDSVDLDSSRSDKTTVHLGLSLEGSGIGFEPGDALMLVPENDPAVVGSLLTAAGLRGEDALAERLRKELDVTTLSRATIEAYQRLRPRPELADLLAGDGWRGFVEGRQAVDLLDAFPSEASSPPSWQLCCAAAAGPAPTRSPARSSPTPGRGAPAGRAGRASKSHGRPPPG